MKLHDIESKQLLPRWAQEFAWIQDAFDAIVKRCAARIPVIDAPLTLDTIAALSDSELQEWFARFGVVTYYPELSRETREKMLFWLQRYYRYLGSPQSVSVLCDYLYDGADMTVVVHDNLAFDESCDLVDESLLDLFDLEIICANAQIAMDRIPRIRFNALRFAPNSQALRNIGFTYPSEITVPVGCCGDSSAVYFYGENDDPARIPQLDFVLIDATTGAVLGGCQYGGGLEFSGTSFVTTTSGIDMRYGYTSETIIDEPAGVILVEET